MKKIVFILLFALFFAVGCKKEDPKDPEIVLNMLMIKGTWEVFEPESSVGTLFAFGDNWANIIFEDDKSEFHLSIEGQIIYLDLLGYGGRSYKAIFYDGSTMHMRDLDTGVVYKLKKRVPVS